MNEKAQSRNAPRRRPLASAFLTLLIAAVALVLTPGAASAASFDGASVTPTADLELRIEFPRSAGTDVVGYRIYDDRSYSWNSAIFTVTPTQHGERVTITTKAWSRIFGDEVCLWVATEHADGSWGSNISTRLCATPHLYLEPSISAAPTGTAGTAQITVDDIVSTGADKLVDANFIEISNGLGSKIYGVGSGTIDIADSSRAGKWTCFRARSFTPDAGFSGWTGWSCAVL